MSARQSSQASDKQIDQAAELWGKLRWQSGNNFAKMLEAITEYNPVPEQIAQAAKLWNEIGDKSAQGLAAILEAITELKPSDASFEHMLLDDDNFITFGAINHLFKIHSYISKLYFVRQCIENQDSVKYSWDNMVVKPAHFLTGWNLNNVIAKPFEDFMNNENLALSFELKLPVNAVLHFSINAAILSTLPGSIPFKVALGAMNTSCFIAERHLAEKHPVVSFVMHTTKVGSSMFLEGSLVSGNTVKLMLGGGAVSMASSYIKNEYGHNDEYGEYDLGSAALALVAGAASGKSLGLTAAFTIPNVCKTFAVLHITNLSHQVLAISKSVVFSVSNIQNLTEEIDKAHEESEKDFYQGIEDYSIAFWMSAKDKYEGASQQAKALYQKVAGMIAYFAGNNSQDNDIEATDAYISKYVPQCIDTAIESSTNDFNNHFYNCADFVAD